VVSTRDDINFSTARGDGRRRGGCFLFMFPAGLGDLRPSENVIRHINMTYTPAYLSFIIIIIIIMYTHRNDTEGLRLSSSPNEMLGTS